MYVEVNILTICLIGSMFFAGVETAMFGIGPLSLVRGHKKRLYWLYSHKDRIVMTCLIGNNITIVGATIMINHIVLSSGQFWTTFMALALEIIVLFLFGEVFPKIIAQQLGLRILEILYYPINIFYHIFIPLSKVFSSLTNFISRFLSTSTTFKREDIFNFLSTQMHGQDIINSLMSLKKTNAKEIMTPLNEIYSLNKNSSITEIMDLLNTTSYSRYPIYEERGDQIIGYVMISDILGASKNEPISNFIQKATYIPEFLSVDQLLSNMQRDKTPMLFVVSELGSIIGLITLEDIAEELVGDIHSKEQPGLEMIKKEQGKLKNTFTLSGVLDIDDFNDYFKLNIKKDGFETLTGFLMKEKMNIPQKNDKLHFDFGSFTILDGDQKNVRKLRFKQNKIT